MFAKLILNPYRRKAPQPATTASKGKGKEAATTAASNSTAAGSSSTASGATSNAATSASANAAAAAQRRQPVGKVIHYFADNQSQGYDGMAFQEAYKTQILAKIQEIQDARNDEKPWADAVDVSEDDLQALVRNILGAQ